MHGERIKSITLFCFLPSDVRFQYSATGRHDTTTSDWIVSPYIRHFNTQLSACNFIDFTFVNYAVLTLYITYPLKNASLKMDTTGG